MPAKIVERVDGQTHKHWIEHDVTRVGGAGMDVALAARRTGEHLLTVEHEDGAYAVYNRSRAPCRIGGRDLPPGSRADWEAGVAIRIGATELTLELTAGGRPSPRPVVHEDAPAEQKGKREGGRTVWFLLAVGTATLCLALVAGLRMLLADPPARPNSANGDVRMRVLEDLHSLWGRDPRYPELQASLQAAFKAETRQRWKEAYVAYRQARDLMAGGRRPVDAGDDPVHAYIGRRLLQTSALAR